jgi:hypothetical protein
VLYIYFSLSLSHPKVTGHSEALVVAICLKNNDLISRLLGHKRVTLWGSTRLFEITVDAAAVCGDTATIQFLMNNLKPSSNARDRERAQWKLGPCIGRALSRNDEGTAIDLVQWYLTHLGSPIEPPIPRWVDDALAHRALRFLDTVLGHTKIVSVKDRFRNAFLGHPAERYTDIMPEVISILLKHAIFDSSNLNHPRFVGSYPRLRGSSPGTQSRLKMRALFVRSSLLEPTRTESLSITAT